MGVSDFTVAVATFGEQSWSDLAHERAIPSAAAQGVEVVHVHGETLHGARNAALDLVSTPWVVYCDADDELEAGYVETMAAASGDLRVPRVRYARDGVAGDPEFPRVAGHRHDCTGDCLPEGNWIIVGAAVRVDMLRSVGGWEAWPWSEDWALWARCWKAGAVIERVPRAIYRAYVRRDSRNRAPDQTLKRRVHRDIHAAVFGEQHEEVAA